MSDPVRAVYAGIGGIPPPVRGGAPEALRWRAVPSGPSAGAA